MGLETAIIPAVGGLLGIGMNQQGQAEQMGNQMHLMDIQQQHQKELNLQMQGIQQQNWDNTNYEAQVKHMKNAGLNVGLMNSNSGGAGGTTMGGASGGSAASGNAPQNNAPAIMGMALQSAMIQSQTKKNEADARSANADAKIKEEYTPGNITADTNLKGITTEGGKLDNALKAGNLQTYIDQAKETLKQTELKNENQVQQNIISKVEAENANANAKIDLITKGLNNIFTKANTNLTNEKDKQVQQDIINSIRSTNAEVRNSITNQQNANTSQWLSNVETKLKQSGLDLQQQGQVIELIKGLIMGGAYLAK